MARTTGGAAFVPRAAVNENQEEDCQPEGRLGQPLFQEGHAGQEQGRQLLHTQGCSGPALLSAPVKVLPIESTHKAPQGQRC